MKRGKLEVVGGPFLFGAKVKKKSACGNARKAKLFGGAKNAKAFLCQKRIFQSAKEKGPRIQNGRGKEKLREVQ